MWPMKDALRDISWALTHNRVFQSISEVGHQLLIYQMKNKALANMK